MILLKFLALLFLAIPSPSTPKPQADCHDPFRNHTRPHECCYYPYLFIANTSASACTPKCQPHKDDACCLFDCTAKKLKIYANDEFLGENLLKLYDANIRSEWEMAGDTWMPVLRDNLERCQKIGESRPA
jgi:hypothetical protein